ncbi:MAG: hypothetical protein PVSMB10_04740 [Pseudarthrobacter sp.]
MRDEQAEMLGNHPLAASVSVPSLGGPLGQVQLALKPLNALRCEPWLLGRAVS